MRKHRQHRLAVKATETEPEALELMAELAAKCRIPTAMPAAKTEQLTEPYRTLTEMQIWAKRLTAMVPQTAMYRTRMQMQAERLTEKARQAVMFRIRMQA